MKTASRSAIVGVSAMLLAAGSLLSLQPASAATDPALDALTAADRATREMAATGLDVVQLVTVSARTDLSKRFTPLVFATVPALSRVRVHGTINAGGASYTSVRRQPSGRLLGAAGRQSASAGLWATVSMLQPESAAAARSNGASARTTITGLPSPDYAADFTLVEYPLVSTLRLILPPYSGAQDEGWSTVAATPRADGTTLISGTIGAGVPASDGEDPCSWPLVEMVVGPDNVTQSSHWIQTCPGKGTREYRATATYGAVTVQPPTIPQMTAARAFR